MSLNLGKKEAHFVYQGDDLIYPNYASKENLVLHYDFSGMKNSDVTKAIAEDLSGNGNNGVLQNFAYIDESGYLDNALIFDGIDDFVTIPEPQIDLDNFTYSEGINVLSFRGDEVATVVDGVVEIGGRNLISSLPINWQQGSSEGGSLVINNSYKPRIIITDIKVNPNTTYTFSMNEGYEIWVPELNENKSGVVRTSAVFWGNQTFITTSNTEYLYVILRKTGTTYNSTNPDDFISPSDIADVNIKLEKGNKVSIEIGGRNYFSIVEFESNKTTYSYRYAYFYHLQLSPNAQYIAITNDENGSISGYSNIYLYSGIFSLTPSTANNGVYIGRPMVVTSDADGYVTLVVKHNLNGNDDGSDGLSYMKIKSGETWLMLKKGNNPTPWTPAPEDLETTTFKPFFDKKIKSALYWNRALTDEELLQVYNTQIKRTEI